MTIVKDGIDVTEQVLRDFGDKPQSSQSLIDSAFAEAMKAYASITEPNNIAMQKAIAAYLRCGEISVVTEEEFVSIYANKTWARSTFHFLEREGIKLTKTPLKPVSRFCPSLAEVIEGAKNAKPKAPQQPVGISFDEWSTSVKDCGHEVQPFSATARQRRLGWDAAMASMNKRESGNHTLEWIASCAQSTAHNTSDVHTLKETLRDIAKKAIEAHT